MLSCGFLDTLLASVGIPLAVEAVKKLFTGSGAPRIGQKAFIKSRGGAAPQIGLPKIFSYPQYVTGQGVKKQPKNKRGKGLPLGLNSPFSNIPILGAIL